MSKNKELLLRVQKVLNGELDASKLSPEEKKEIEGILGSDDKLQKGADALGLADTAEYVALLGEVVKSAANGPNYLATLEKKVKRGETAEKLSANLGVLFDLTQVGVGLSQIGKSKRALSGLSQPGLPSAPKEDRALSNALSDASRGTFNASRAVSPVAREIRNRILAEQMMNRQIAGGQAGAVGAMNQASSIRGLAAMGELAPMIDSIRAREQARYDQLLGMRQDQRQNDFQNSLSLFDRSNEQYLQQQRAAGELGQAGRENLFGGLGNLTDDLSVAASGIDYDGLLKRKLSNYTGIKEQDAMDAKVNSFLAKSISPDPNNKFDASYVGGYYNKQLSNPAYRDTLSSDLLAKRKYYNRF